MEQVDAQMDGIFFSKSKKNMFTLLQSLATNWIESWDEVQCNEMLHQFTNQEMTQITLEKGQKEEEKK